MIVTVCRREHFNGAHRIFRKDWPEQKNWEVFGKCSYKNYHGHNYTLEVRVSGPVDEETGYVYDMSKLGRLIREHVTSLLDHRNFNQDVPYFREIIPTTEHVAIFIYNQLRPHIGAGYGLSIVLHETEKNSVIYPAGTGSA